MIYMHDRDEIKKPKREYAPVKLPVRSYNLEHGVLAVQYLEQRGLCPVLAEQNGWYPSVDFQEGLPRLVIPCWRTDRKAHWQARDITGHSPIRYTSPFAPRGDALVLLFPREKGDAYRTVVVCEGPMDALAAIGTGSCDAAIALMGNNPGEPVWSHVQGHIQKYDHVFIVQDSDAATEVARYWLPKIARYAKGLSLVLPSPAKDFAELSPEQRKQKLVR